MNSQMNLARILSTILLPFAFAATGCAVDANDDSTPSDDIGTAQSELASDAVNVSLSVTQGYQFNRASHASFGFVSSMSVYDKTLAADVSAYSPPVDGWQSQVGILESVNWNGLETGNISFSARFSPANRDLLAGVLATQSGTRGLKFTLVVYAWNTAANNYIQRFLTTNPYTGKATGNHGPREPADGDAGWHFAEV